MWVCLGVRDSLWADQTPARVEDIEAAFKADGGLIPWDLNPYITQDELIAEAGEGASKRDIA